MQQARQMEWYLNWLNKNEPLLLNLPTVLFAQWPNTIGQWFKLIQIEMSLKDAVTRSGQ